MPVPYTDVPKKEQQELCSDTDGVCLNLGKKISVPRDLMMEELNLMSNRGSIMFHERLKRVERFTLENIAKKHLNHLEETLEGQNAMQGEKGSDCFTSEIYIKHPGKNSLVTTLKHTVSKKGNPSVLAPGYGGPLKEVPPEKFNVTVIPKSYQSPWEEKPIDNETLLANISIHLPEPPYKLTPANYKCFNRYSWTGSKVRQRRAWERTRSFWLRAPTPFGGTAGTVRTLPLPGFEMLQAHTEPHLTWDRMCHRPNFNRTPQGWGIQYASESPDL